MDPDLSFDAEASWRARKAAISYRSDAPACQDRWFVEEAFEAALSKGYRGWFVEAGAADGLGASNTFVLEKEFGWTGLLVEPNKLFFEQLARHRSSICVNVALDRVDGSVDFISAGYLGAALAHVKPVLDKYSIDPARHGNYQRDADGSLARRETIPARSLTSLLVEHAAPPIVDVLALDIGGGEFVVLSGVDFDRFRFRVITLETRFYLDAAQTNLVDHEHRGPCRRLLEEKGYRLAKTVGPDDFYVYDGA